MKKYIITEGKTEANFLTKVLPPGALFDTKIIAAGGYSAALSLTRSVLIDNVDKIILFLDSDTPERRQVIDRLFFVKEYLMLDAFSENKVHTILAVPHFESFILSVPYVVKRHFPNLTDNDLTQIKYNPSAFKLYGNLKDSIRDFIMTLDEHEVKLYRESGYISHMIDILNGISNEYDNDY